MQTEIEAKFLDINVDLLRTKLKTHRAILVKKERLMKRKTFDFEDGKLRKVHGWVRIRDEGDKTTLSYKQLNDRSFQGTKEISVNISSFNDSCKLLEAIGMKMKSYQETKRESWLLDDVEIEIDTWPWIPQFVEFEGKSEEIVINISAKLGFNWEKALHGSVETAYQAIYNVSEDEINSWEEIRFIPIPVWLESKRIK